MSSPLDKLMPRPDLLNDMEYGKFVLTNLAAKRAKQLRDGAPPLVRIQSSHPLSIALAEIAAGKIKPQMAGEQVPAVEIDDTAPVLSEDVLEVGLLLPSLEDDEDLSAVAGLTPEELEEADEEDETDLDAAGSLGDLLEDTEEELDSTLASESDEDEISLDDLAKEEGSDDEEEAGAEE